MKREKLVILYVAFKEALTENVKNNPQKYAKSFGSGVIDANTASDFIFNQINKDGIESIEIKTDSWKLACKNLGIKNTYKDIKKFLTE